MFEPNSPSVNASVDADVPAAWVSGRDVMGADAAGTAASTVVDEALAFQPPCFSVHP